MGREFKIKSVTTAIIAVNVLFFLIFNLLLPDAKSYLMMVKPLALSGDYWRFLTSMFVHADIMHLFMNMLCLFVFGRLTELFFGPLKFSVIYVLSGLTGSAISILSSDYSSLGASGAIFGVIAANIYMLTKMDGETKKAFASDILGFIVINIGFSFFNSDVDLGAHVGGLLGGVTSGYAFGHVRENTFALRTLYRPLSVFLMVALLLWGGFLAKMSSPADYDLAIRIRFNSYGAANAKRLAEDAAEKFPNERLFQGYVEYLKHPDLN